MISVLISEATELNQKESAQFVGKPESQFAREVKAKLWDGCWRIPPGRKDKVFIAGKLKERQYKLVEEYHMMQV